MGNKRMINFCLAQKMTGAGLLWCLDLITSEKIFGCTGMGKGGLK